MYTPETLEEPIAASSQGLIDPRLGSSADRERNPGGKPPRALSLLLCANVPLGPDPFLQLHLDAMIPSHVFEQVALMAAEESREYFYRPQMLFGLDFRIFRCH